MKRYNVKSIRMAAMVILLFAITWTCTETVTNTCEEYEDIALTVKGSYSFLCNGAKSIEAASNAQILVLQTNKVNGRIDTLYQDVLDANGQLYFVVPNSKCGISNVTMIATYNAFVYKEVLDFMCCDTTFLFDFEQNCDELTQSEVSCSTMDTTIILELSNPYGGCIPIGATQTDIRYNGLTISSNDNITIDLNPIIAQKGKFYANLSPAPATGGTILVNRNNPLSMVFFVKTNQLGTFDTTFVLPTTCTTSGGSVSNGTVRIRVMAEVCDDACACPFPSNRITMVKVDKSDEEVPANTVKDYNQQMVLEVINGMLEEGCYMNVKSIGRYNSTASAYTIASLDEATLDWIITAPQSNLPIKLVEGSKFYLSARFMPDKAGISADTFEIALDVFNASNTLKESCKFHVNFVGKSCENVCPEFVVYSSPAELLNGTTNAVIRPLGTGETIQMGSGNKVRQSISSYLGNLCTAGISTAENATFGIRVPQNPGAINCAGLDVKLTLFDDGQVGDMKFFDAYKTISLFDDFSIGVRFTPPDLRQHITSAHGATYRSRLVVDVSDKNGNFICSQEVKVEGKVDQSTTKLSKPLSMKAFSQISDKEPKAAYQVYKIDDYNAIYKYYGKLDNLDPESKYVNMASIPPVPVSNHSFYFEVDNPKQVANRQYPKLYLVNTELNKYSKITAVPVANFSNNKDFADNLDILVEQIFKQGNFNSMGNAPITSFNFSTINGINWTPNRNAAEIALAGTGIPLKLGDVFIIWNPNGGYESFNLGAKLFSNFCDVALLYIDGYSDGTGTNHNIGNVSFYVAYPLHVIED